VSDAGAVLPAQGGYTSTEARAGTSHSAPNQGRSAEELGLGGAQEQRPLRPWLAVTMQSAVRRLRRLRKNLKGSQPKAEPQAGPGATLGSGARGSTAQVAVVQDLGVHVAGAVVCPYRHHDDVP
jgi:hypothetical protein